METNEPGTWSPRRNKQTKSDTMLKHPNQKA